MVGRSGHVLSLRRAALAAVVAGTCIATGCSLAFPVEDYRGQAPADAAAPDSPPNVVAVPDPDAGCVARRLPERPAVQGGGGLEFVVALDAFEFGDSTALPFAGFDLDGTCTCPGPPSCAPTLSERAPCDAPGGVDNAAGRIFAGVLNVGAPGASTSARLRAGYQTTALRVRNFNGTSNDNEVEAMLITVLGTPIGQGVPPPNWDGQDVRIPDSNLLSVSEPLIARIVDPQAFVRDGSLVVSFAGTVLVGELSLPLVDGHMVAKLELGGTNTSVSEGHLLGRVVLPSLLGALGRLEDPQTKDAGFCMSPLYAQVKELFCRARDIHVDPKSDGLTSPCDAVSFSARFTAPAIKLGAPAPSLPASEYCPTFVDDCL